MPNALRASIIFALAVIGVFAIPGRAWSTDWLPVTPDELHMTSEPKAPRAPAICLDYVVERDDGSSAETVYKRIKVLTDEGRKYGDVEIRFDANREYVDAIEARTIHPDGSIVRFDGKAFETPIVKAHGVRYMAKTFTLPDVQPGSIIEYRYRRRGRNEGFTRYIYNSQWILNTDLFIRHGKFTLYPERQFTLAWSWPHGLPEGAGPPEKKKDRIELETHDVPAFVTEEYMPPENALKQRVDFIYTQNNTPTDFDKFWNGYSREQYRQVSAFIDHRAIAKAIAELVSSDDSPEDKLRKIYARVQRVRNLSFESSTSTEQVREQLKSIHDAVDVWERGYGDGEQLTWLFLALVRAAGLAADPVLVSTRDEYFFTPKALNPGPLNTNVVRVRLADKELYLDPGAALTPFGLLPWPETGVPGLVLTRDGGSWITTPTPRALESRVEHKATLRVSENGTLQGHVTVTYSGLEALELRAAERHEDAAGRKHYLETELQDDIPTGSDVKLLNQPDWESSSALLVAEFDLSVPGWMASAGSRLLLPEALFSGHSKHMFTHSARVQPVYFTYPCSQDDDITISVPASLKTDAMPQAKTLDLGALSYRIATERAADGLHQTRQLAINGVLIAAKQYSPIYEFFQAVRNQDEQQVIIGRSTTAQAH